MLEDLKARFYEKERWFGLAIVAGFALILLILPPMFDVTQLRPLAGALFVAIPLSFFHQKEETEPPLVEKPLIESEKK